MTDYFHLNAGPELIQGISSLGLAHLGDDIFIQITKKFK